MVPGNINSSPSWNVNGNSEEWVGQGERKGVRIQTIGGIDTHFHHIFCYSISKSYLVSFRV